MRDVLALAPAVAPNIQCFPRARLKRHSRPMAASRKQAIYTRILDLALPYARSVQTWPWWRRLRTDLYPELELVHNIGPLLREPQFTLHDVYWINTQARNYDTQRAARDGISPTVLSEIAMLIALVPTDLRPALTWHGADDVPKAYEDRQRRGNRRVGIG